VRAPIRYGRRSTKRDNTFTMVFSRLVERSNYGMGTAAVVKCRRPVTSVEHLNAEARRLWIAESPDGTPIRPYDESWGAIGVLFNPHSRRASKLRESWVESHAGSLKKKYGHLTSERPLLDSARMLSFRWPLRPDGEPVRQCDVLLAAVTAPHLAGERYPSAAEIADAWIDGPAGREEYFFRNLEHGITTFQDGRIWARMKRRAAAAGDRAACDSQIWSSDNRLSGPGRAGLPDLSRRVHDQSRSGA
jgi:hypothetical protein